MFTLKIGLEMDENLNNIPEYLLDNICTDTGCFNRWYFYYSLKTNWLLVRVI